MVLLKTLTEVEWRDHLTNIQSTWTSITNLKILHSLDKISYRRNCYHFIIQVIISITSKASTWLTLLFILPPTTATQCPWDVLHLSNLVKLSSKCCSNIESFSIESLTSISGDFHQNSTLYRSMRRMWNWDEYWKMPHQNLISMTNASSYNPIEVQERTSWIDAAK